MAQRHHLGSLRCSLLQSRQGTVRNQAAPRGLIIALRWCLPALLAHNLQTRLLVSRPVRPRNSNRPSFLNTRSSIVET